MAIIYAAPSTRPLEKKWREAADGTQSWALDLQTALNRARPGDSVRLLPGRYVQPVHLHVSGLPDRPIRIMAEVPDTVILDGERSARHALHAGMEPMDGDFAMLKLISVGHIELVGLRFQNAWPVCIYMRSAHHITVTGCAGTDGRYFVYLRQHDLAPTHDITLDGCSWVQDTDHDMRRGTITWSDVKKDDEKKDDVFDASYLNGAFLGGFDVQGRLVVRNCEVAHVFNVVRLDMRRAHINRDGTVQRNRDVAIFDNRFGFVRDNVIEPETGAQNWRVFNNSIYASHAAFSLDQVAGRDLFFVGNTILNDHRPGLIGKDGSDDEHDNQGGRIVKLLKAKDGAVPVDRQGLYLLHNSILTRTAYSKRGRTAQLLDANSLLGLLPKGYPEASHEPRVPFEDMDWSNIQIRDMVCDAAGFPDDVGAPEGTITGHHVDQVFEAPEMWSRLDHPVFTDPLAGWSGRLQPTRDAKRVSQEPLSLDTQGEDITLPAGVPLGAVDVNDLGLDHWRMPWGAPEVG